MSKDAESGGKTQDDKKDDVFEKGPNEKIIRLVTVAAYMFAISSTGMTLSFYYIFLWNPPEPKAHIIHNKKFTDHRPQYLAQVQEIPSQPRAERLTANGPKTWDEIVDEVSATEPAKLVRFLQKLAISKNNFLKENDVISSKQGTVASTTTSTQDDESRDKSTSEPGDTSQEFI